MVRFKAWYTQSNVAFRTFGSDLRLAIIAAASSLFVVASVSDKVSNLVETHFLIFNGHFTFSSSCFWWLAMCWQVRHCQVSTKLQLDKFRIFFPCQLPWILYWNIQHPSEQGPPPLLSTNRNAICIHILICSVSAAHVAVVIVDSVRNWNLNMLLFSLTPSFCRTFRISSKASRSNRYNRIIFQMAQKILSPETLAVATSVYPQLF